MGAALKPTRFLLVIPACAGMTRKSGSKFKSRNHHLRHYSLSLYPHSLISMYFCPTQHMGLGLIILSCLCWVRFPFETCWMCFSRGALYELARRWKSVRIGQLHLMCAPAVGHCLKQRGRGTQAPDGSSPSNMRSRYWALPFAARARNISSGRLFAALCRSPQDLFRGRQLLGLARWCDDKSSGNGQAQAPEVKRWFLPLFEISLRAKARVSPAPQLCGYCCEGFSHVRNCPEHA